MIRAGEQVLGYEMDGFWTDLGTPERYASIQKRLEEGDPLIGKLLKEC